MLRTKAAVLASLLGASGGLSLRRQRSLQTSSSSNIPDGIWTSRGYGVALDVADNSTSISAFEETSISCISNNDFLEEIVSTNMTKKDKIVAATSGVAPVTFDRSEKFQYGCSNGTMTLVEGDEGYERNALDVFDILVVTFSEHYAFFEQRNISWDTMTATVRETLSADSTDDELFDALVGILDPLNDGHVQIIVPDEEFYSSKPLEIITRIEQEYGEQTDFDDFETFQNYLIGSWIQTVGGFMENNTLHGDIDTFLYGTFATANIGYMMFQGFSTEDNDESYMDSLDEAFASLKSTDAMIVDIRVNTGGEDRIAFLVASYFAKTVTPVFSKKAWDRHAAEGFTESTDVVLDPTTSPNAYDGEVVVLVSGSTVSAAEIFTLAMAQMEPVTIIGRPTSGEFSDILPRKLPNGWLFGLSNEVYAAPDGTVYEIVGIPPDILPTAELLPLEEILSGEDSWLDEALAFAEQSLLMKETSSATNVLSGTVVAGFLSILATTIAFPYDQLD